MQLRCGFCGICACFVSDVALINICLLQVDPSSLERGHGEIMRKHDKDRRWLVSIVPREGNAWPYKIEANDWGANAAASLKQIILRYRLDGIDVDFEDPHSNQTIFTTGMCSLFRNLKQHLPGVIVSTAFYGNPEAQPRSEIQRTIPLYKKLKTQCDDSIDFYNYQNYANWVDDVSSNIRHIQMMGHEFGWRKFVWGIGVGGQRNSQKWRWWPSNPGVKGAQIMQSLLADDEAKEMLGVFTWAGEMSKKYCYPSWCAEDKFRQQLAAPDVAVEETPCSCHDQP